MRQRSFRREQIRCGNAILIQIVALQIGLVADERLCRVTGRAEAS